MSGKMSVYSDNDSMGFHWLLNRVDLKHLHTIGKCSKNGSRAWTVITEIYTHI